MATQGQQLIECSAHFRAMNHANEQTTSRKPPPLAGSILARITAWVSEGGLWVLWRLQRGRIDGELPSGPVVVVANHGSYLDWLLLSIVSRRRFGRHIRFLAKQKVAQNPWFRLLLDASAAIVMADGYSGRAVALALRALQSNDHLNSHALGVFPEGTRSRDGKKLPCSEGAALLARRCDAVIVPVALCGFGEVWPPHRKLPRLRRVGLSIHFLPSINPKEFADDQAAVDYAMDQCYALALHKRMPHPQKETAE